MLDSKKVMAAAACKKTKTEKKMKSYRIIKIQSKRKWAAACTREHTTIVPQSPYQSN